MLQASLNSSNSSNSSNSLKTGSPCAVCARLILCLSFLLPCQTRAADDNIPQLIEGLDSPQYSVRENATNQLVQMGKPALRLLAQQYFTSTPEKAWRIKRILEQIGTTNDDPETCFKSIGILIVLDANIGDGIIELLNEWRDNRSKKAMDFLASQGMQFSREYTGINRQIEALNVDIRQVLEEELAGRKKQSSSLSDPPHAQLPGSTPCAVLLKRVSDKNYLLARLGALTIIGVGKPGV
ncbi:MAG: hypothetical protein MK106_15055, partial [Mariniblastus sp.]|nr:hypothetical protein [Mariniblastus sp.]